MLCCSALKFDLHAREYSQNLNNPEFPYLLHLASVQVFLCTINNHFMTWGGGEVIMLEKISIMHGIIIPVLC